jgi:hypothetical protein
MSSQLTEGRNGQLTVSAQVSLKEKTADPKHYEAAKKQVEEQGGKIVNEYKLVKGFTYVYLLAMVQWDLSLRMSS